ncbi:MAG: type II/IV secretion system protein [Myxococcaceae bacterium]|nr:type II/IV secretion system protein [Myxococcaceae bacterium]
MGSRLAISALLVSAATIALVLFLPDSGALGRTPQLERGLAWVGDAAASPLVWVPFALGFAMLVLSRRQAGPGEVLHQQATLGPIVASANLVERLAATRAALEARGRGRGGRELLELLVQAGVRLRASDLHVQPTEAGATVSGRVDGVLQGLLELDRAENTALINRLKVMARLTHYVSDKPQDGQFALDTPDGRADVRLSLLPTSHGEKAVLRLTGLGNAAPTFPDLHLPDSVQRQLSAVLAKPQGLVCFTGPVGSGKTTTIYASVRHLKESRGGLVQVSSIEDPIEYPLDGVAQTQVNRVAGLDFAAGLRALLRQDPNVLVVGEIRDVETARIATQAGLTGHLILTTVHANSAPAVFNRLLEMGVEPSVLASVSLAVFSQRLLRRLCRECRVATPVGAEQRSQLTAMGELPDGYFTAPGCQACGGSGVSGRVAVFEVLMMTDAMRELLLVSPSSHRLMATAVEQGMVPLRSSALALARTGEVSLAEALRVAD